MNDWEEEIDKVFVYDYFDDTGLEIIGIRADNRPATIQDIKHVVRQQKELSRREGYMEAVNRLWEFAKHSRNCILSFFEAGRPTEDGGYEQKFRGRWYSIRPVDNTPKCDCGLDDLLRSKLLPKDE